MTDWGKFFKRHADYAVEGHFYECRSTFTLDELYQAFKARLEEEEAMTDETAEITHKQWERMGKFAKANAAIITYAQVVQAVARGWCSKENKHKDMDAVLATAIADEVWRTISATAKATDSSSK